MQSILTIRRGSGGAGMGLAQVRNIDVEEADG